MRCLHPISGAELYLNRYSNPLTVSVVETMIRCEHGIELGTR